MSGWEEAGLIALAILLAFVFACFLIFAMGFLSGLRKSIRARRARKARHLRERKSP